jgi:hypothetical protein
LQPPRAVDITPEGAFYMAVRGGWLTGARGEGGFGRRGGAPPVGG